MGHEALTEMEGHFADYAAVLVDAEWQELMLAPVEPTQAAGLSE